MSVTLAQLTGKIDPMYIIPKGLSEWHNDACVICFWSFSNFGSSSGHRQDGPQVYCTTMTSYLDIHETFFNLRILSCQLMAAILDFIIFLVPAQLTDKMDPMYIIPKWLPTWIFMIFFLLFFRPLNCQLMAAILDLAIFGSSSANRRDGPHVYYTKSSVWAPCWCTCNLFFSVSNDGHQGPNKVFFWH